MRGKNYPAIPIFILLFLFTSGIAFAGPGSCGGKEQEKTRLADETLAKIALLPDAEISLSGTLFLISARATRDLFCKEANGSLAEKELDRIANRVLAAAGDISDPANTVSALNRVLFGEEKFVYEHIKGDPEGYLLDRVLSRKRGNCLGITSVYLAIAERLKIPLAGVYVPSHCFVRYDGNGSRINIETGEKGAEREDAWYERKFQLKEGGPYLRTMATRQMVGVYLKSLGTAYSGKGMEQEALRLYREAAVFSPDLPDAYYNAGVSLQKLGKVEDAIVQYRKALEMDPDMAPARGNLASALCGCGKIDEGIGEFLKALTADPGNKTALAGLARAYYVKGDYSRAAIHCDMAMKEGCRFDPAMLETLSRYRNRKPG